mgnify:CR=1 FL=1
MARRTGTLTRKSALTSLFFLLFASGASGVLLWVSFPIRITCERSSGEPPDCQVFRAVRGLALPGSDLPGVTGVLREVDIGSSRHGSRIAAAWLVFDTARGKVSALRWADGPFHVKNAEGRLLAFLEDTNASRLELEVPGVWMTWPIVLWAVFLVAFPSLLCWPFVGIPVLLGRKRRA